MGLQTQVLGVERLYTEDFVKRRRMKRRDPR